LVSAGVDPSMLAAKGYGSANPVATNDTLEGKFRNRRIEYRVTKDLVTAAERVTIRVGVPNEQWSPQAQLINEFRSTIEAVGRLCKD
jgi:hypothetical protein